MKEALKIIKECVFSTRYDKKQRLDKLDSLRQKIYSEFEWRHKININYFDLIDNISLKINDRANYKGEDSPLTLDNSECLESEVERLEKVNLTN